MKKEIKLIRRLLIYAANGILWVAMALMAPPAAHADVEAIPTAGRNVYRLTVARAGEEHRIIGSTWDNRLCALGADGRRLWDAALGGFAYDLCCADLDGDGVDEILTAGADGIIGCFAADGKERWKHTLPAPVLQVTVARLDGKTPVVLAGGISRQIVALSPAGKVLRTVSMDAGFDGAMVRLLRAGDFDGDGTDEVALMGLRGEPKAIRFLKGMELKPLPITAPKYVRITANGSVADVNGDKAAELLLGVEVLSLKGLGSRNVRRLAQLPDRPNARSYDYYYRMRSLAAGNLAGDPAVEILTLDGPDLQLCTAEGRILESAHAPLSFSDAVFLPGSPHGCIVLGSGLGGDDNLYRVTFEPGWNKQLASLPRSSLRKVIADNLGQVIERAANWQGQPMAGAGGPYDIVVNHYIWGAKNTWGTETRPKEMDHWVEEVRFFEKNFPYPNLRFSTCIWPGEKLPLMRPDGKEWPHDARVGHNLTREQMAAIARRFEQERCPFWIQVGHGCAPHLSVEGATAMLEAAPTMCLGFVSAEDEQADQMTYYFEHIVRPLLDLCLAHGKKFIPRNKHVWWCHWPDDPTMRRLVFNGKYRSVLLPCVEESNTRTADAHLAARVGLWLDGQVEGWACRCSADWFCFNRTWEWEAMLTGHPYLRYYVSEALLGARVYMLLNGDLDPRRGQWTRVGAEGLAPFLHMLGRGAITPPRREQLKAISPVVLNVRQATERFIEHGANGHHFERWNLDGTESKVWAFDRMDCYWGMAPLPDTDVSTYLWGRTRRSSDQIPLTAPHGFVCMLPGPVTAPDGPWGAVWTTDGDRMLKDGKQYGLKAAREAMQADLQAGMAKLPFLVEGNIFWQVVAQSEDRYVVCLMDPGWVDPADRSVVLRAQTPGAWTVCDRLSGQALGEIGQGLTLTVPAGIFKLLDVTLKKS